MTVQSVHFGTTSVPFTVVNATTITAAAPAGLAGAQNVRVTTTHGQSAISAAFTYVAAAAPTISAVNPNTGPAAGATPVTITGTGFTGATAARFGATNGAAFNVVSDTQITVTSPAGSGVVQVVVLHPNGNSAGVNFTYAAALTAPVITSPNSANATEGTMFSYIIYASGNPAPTLNATGLPAWLTRTGAVVSGTPPALSGNTSVNFTVTASNSEGTPSMVVTVNIAEPTAGWTVDWTFPNQLTFNWDTGRIPFANIPGWNPAWAADINDELYDFPNMAAMPVNLYASFPGQPFVLVDFEGFPISHAPNKVGYWAYNSTHVPPGIFIVGNNGTGGPIQLRLVKT